VRLAGLVKSYPWTGAARVERSIPLGNVLQMVEGYLLAAILIIFALGLYELFIARIDLGASNENRGH